MLFVSSTDCFIREENFSETRIIAIYDELKPSIERYYTSTSYIPT